MNDVAEAHEKRPETRADRRTRAAATSLCAAVERRMDELIGLVEEETALVREGRLQALKRIEPRKSHVAREFIAGLDAVKKIRPALERHAPEAIYRLRRRHSEFRAMLQLNMAALATAREASDDMMGSLAAARPGGGPP